VHLLSGLAAFFNLSSLLILALVFLPLERLFAIRRAQKILRRTIEIDLFYCFAINQITRLGLTLLLGLALAGTAISMPEGVGRMVRAQPLWLQFAEALLLLDTGIYLVHRSFHAVPFLWRFHAVHHSSEELDWMSSFRNHPVDLIATRFFSVLPIFALGFASEAVAALLLFQQAQAALVHANIRTDFGPLNRILVSPHFHHWHHADERHAYDRNFAGHLAFLDWIGGTLYRPGAHYPEKYGVAEAPPLDRPLRQLIDPFRRPRSPAALPAE
jgi:sterol desaturase/sphingolipid hydroxylase (fatty acid hydroxylase superfamily)